MESPHPKPLLWVASAKADFMTFPGSVQDVMGYALYLAQCGSKHAHAKPLRGFGGAGVLEATEQHDGDAYRAVYTVRFAEGVYVLHAFEKKPKSGIATPKADIDLIKARLRAVERQREHIGDKDE
jgi:phage-related protein